MTSMNQLHEMKCAPGGQAVALSADDIALRLGNLEGWLLEGKEIIKTFAFKNYDETMAFVNASAWISNREDHHPDIGLHYNRCVVRYSTHDAGGITLNDLICAAKINRLFDL